MPDRLQPGVLVTARPANALDEASDAAKPRNQEDLLCVLLCEGLQQRLPHLFDFDFVVVPVVCRELHLLPCLVFAVAVFELHLLWRLVEVHSLHAVHLGVVGGDHCLVEAEPLPLGTDLRVVEIERIPGHLRCIGQLLHCGHRGVQHTAVALGPVHDVNLHHRLRVLGGEGCHEPGEDPQPPRSCEVELREVAPAKLLVPHRSRRCCCQSLHHMPRYHIRISPFREVPRPEHLHQDLELLAGRQGPN